MDEAIKVFFILAAVVGGPLLAVTLIPPLVKRLLGTMPPAPRARTGDGDGDDRELERLSERVAELEERVDFAERLLARQREGELPRPRS
jgi:hypothetical protein